MSPEEELEEELDDEELLLDELLLEEALEDELLEPPSTVLPPHAPIASAIPKTVYSFFMRNPSCMYSRGLTKPK